MLLAFFVALSSATTFDTQRVAVAVSGIQESFARQPTPPAANVESPKSTAQASLCEAVTTAFAAVLPGYEIVVPPAADRIDVRVPITALFDDGLFDLKSTLPVLDRLVGVLTAPPPGFRFEVILSATAGQDDPAIAVVRADAIARGLVARSLLSDLISAGSATPGTPQVPAVIFTFLVLDAEDAMPFGRYAGTGGRSRSAEFSRVRSAAHRRRGC